MSVAGPPPPPPSAAEALSGLLWQPYDCRSPPPPRHAPPPRQSPRGARRARASLTATMRLPVPAPKADSVCVRVPGEPAPNVSSVHIVQVQDASDSAVQTQQRSVVSAECQTEERPWRRRARRARRQPPLDVPPPPYSTLPLPPPPPQPPLPPLHPAAPVIAPLPAAHRFPFQPIPLRSGRGAAYACSEGDGNAPKSCCGRPPLRLCVLFLGVVGACLVAAGAVLGALRPHPRAPLTLLLLMIGIGILLVTAAGLAWRLGARDAPCALLGLRRASCRRFVPRLPPSYARPHHPYAAMLYPEFHYRPPPPTYQASMQEYRLRLLLLDRSAPANAVSPPPTYRSNSATLVRGTTGAAWCGSEYSGPPSYRAPRNETTITVTDSLPPLTPLDLKYAEDSLEALPKQEEKDPDEHLVTIVHTDAQPVIVTVSGSLSENETHPQQTEIDILAHL
ncbi:WAS/WASL-interacting protein family member 3 isoform X2 [Plutella xylostella]|nr:WAS/WASL-interacting protein family member 3 isoform X2 [Plutella xylostella]